MSETTSRILETLIVILQLKPDQVGPGVSAAQLEKWDSLGHMSLMLALEEEFSVVFSNEEIAQLKSVAEISAAIDGKKVQDE